MIDTKSMGIRISEMAIRGQLSKRVKPSLSIDDIIENIKSERDSLIKEKATKISKVSSMLEDETFDIPNSWKWVALGDLCILLSRGKSPKYSEVKKYPVFAQKCNQPNCLALDKALFLDETTLDKWPEYFRLREADVVINSTGTGTVGRVGYYTTETLNSNYAFMLPDSHVTVVRTGKNVSSRYIYYALRTATLQSIMEKTFRGSTNQKEFYIDSVYSIPIPLPPVEEQEEIVKTLDEVFEQLKIIDDLQAKYSNDLTVLKSKIIDAGIRGKLTEQLPEDGNAEELYAQILDQKSQLIKEGKIKKEKPLPEITEDEIPFEIPKNWKWVRLYCISNKITDGTHHSPVNTSIGDYMYITAKNIKPYGISLDDITYVSSEIHNEIYSRCNPEKDDVLLIKDGATTGVVTVNNLDYPFSLLSSVALIKCSEYVEPWYLVYAMRSSWFSKHIKREMTGVGITRVVLRQIENFVMPLPPLAEQKRIVSKIDMTLQQL